MLTRFVTPGLIKDICTQLTKDGVDKQKTDRINAALLDRYQVDNANKYANFKLVFLKIPIGAPNNHAFVQSVELARREDLLVIEEIFENRAVDLGDIVKHDDMSIHWHVQDSKTNEVGSETIQVDKWEDIVSLQVVRSAHISFFVDFIKHDNSRYFKNYKVIESLAQEARRIRQLEESGQADDSEEEDEDFEDEEGEDDGDNSESSSSSGSERESASPCSSSSSSKKRRASYAPGIQILKKAKPMVDPLTVIEKPEPVVLVAPPDLPNMMFRD